MKVRRFAAVPMLSRGGLPVANVSQKPVGKPTFTRSFIAPELVNTIVPAQPLATMKPPTAVAPEQVKFVDTSKPLTAVVPEQVKLVSKSEGQQPVVEGRFLPSLNRDPIVPKADITAPKTVTAIAPQPTKYVPLDPPATDTAVSADAAPPIIRVPPASSPLPTVTDAGAGAQPISPTTVPQTTVAVAPPPVKYVTDTDTTSVASPAQVSIPTPPAQPGTEPDVEQVTTENDVVQKDTPVVDVRNVRPPQNLVMQKPTNWKFLLGGAAALGIGVYLIRRNS